MSGASGGEEDSVSVLSVARGRSSSREINGDNVVDWIDDNLGSSGMSSTSPVSEDELEVNGLPAESSVVSASACCGWRGGHDWNGSMQRRGQRWRSSAAG
jgi:hypothetical protein